MVYVNRKTQERLVAQSLIFEEFGLSERGRLQREFINEICVCQKQKRKREA